MRFTIFAPFAPLEMSTSLGWYNDGGPAMLLILFAGLAGVVVLLERAYVIVFRSKINGRAFIERTIQLVHAGRIDDAIKQCVAAKAALPDMGLLILRSRSRDEAALETVAQAAALTVLPRLTRRLQYLSALAAAAIMLGVIGALADVRSVLAASTLARDARDARIDAALAAACIPPIFGLAIATILVLGRSYLVSQAEAITEQVREFSARLVNALIDRPDVRLGHR